MILRLDHCRRLSRNHTSSYSVQKYAAPWTLNKRDIQTVPAFLWEGGDGLLLLEPHMLQTSTFEPFESNVTRGMQKRSGQKEPGETKCSHLQPDFTLGKGGMRKSGGKSDRRVFCIRSDLPCRPKVSILYKRKEYTYELCNRRRPRNECSQNRFG